MTGTFDRAANLARIADEAFDLLVVGGGITGAGVALDAATRGLRVALVERDDFASGTSSKSSKMVHGGLRYLQNGDIRLVYEALRERQRLLRNAPHLVEVLPFLLPMFSRDGLIHPKLEKALNSAMWMYDVTGGARIGKLHERLTAAETLAYMPTLPAERIGGGYLYYDARADDARLTLTLAKTAAAHGAAVVNHAAVADLVHEGGRVVGATVVATTGVRTDRIPVRARAVVNAAGVWSDDVRAQDEGVHPDSIRPAKGVHLTVPWHLVQNKIAVVVPVPEDKRSVFVVPWSTEPDGPPQFSYIGTTDTDFDGDVDDPQCTSDDVRYLLDAINHSMTTTITEADVTGTWAGLRPLVKAAASGRTADLSRNHAVRVGHSGMVTITGGKLTTYREMAADTVDAVADVLDLPRFMHRSRTARIPLVGAEGFAPEVARRQGGAEAVRLQRRYGGDARKVELLAATDPTLAEPIVDGLAYTGAEVVFAARHEMATTIDDILERRTRALLFSRDAASAAAGRVGGLLAAELGWSDRHRDHEIAAFQARADLQRQVPGLPATRPSGDAPAGQPVS